MAELIKLEKHIHLKQKIVNLIDVVNTLQDLVYRIQEGCTSREPEEDVGDWGNSLISILDQAPSKIEDQTLRIGDSLKNLEKALFT